MVSIVCKSSLLNGSAGDPNFLAKLIIPMVSLFKIIGYISNSRLNFYVCIYIIIIKIFI